MSNRSNPAEPFRRPLPRATRGGRREGFTMVEALVAFTILAIVMIAVQRAVVISLGGTKRAQTRVEAEMVARTLMTGPLGIGPAAAQPKSGQMNGLDWTMRFEPVNLPFQNAPSIDGKPPAWLPMRMIVQVSSKGASQPDLTIRTVRLLKVASQ